MSEPKLAGVPDAIDYNWHVRPILSENCFKCHGPDPDALEAGLRLDLADSAHGELPEWAGHYAIVAGDSDASELVRRIMSSDPEERMPPASEHKVLTPVEIEILSQWINSGAQYKPHWAFIRPERPQSPELSAAEFAGRVASPIDSFVFSRLQSEGVAPSPEADRETLINRVSLTVTGLPPTLAEVDAFVSDDAPDAYASLVDRLLASPRYAEHLSAYWMDLARWSESDGFLDDHHDRFLWPYRDWVIDAFAQNMPYDEFGTAQLAGDLLPNASREQILATAYLRVGKRTTENGAIDEEYQAETMIERTDNALGIAFMGLTLGCARCHDHKYDPISQRDYYSLAAFFNSSDEPGVYAPGFSGTQAGPTLAWADERTSRRIAELETNIAALESSYLAARDAAMIAAGARADGLLADSAAELRLELDNALAGALAAHYPFESVTKASLRDLPPPRPGRPAPDSIVEFDNASSPASVERRRLQTLQPPPAAPAAARERTEAELFGNRVPRTYVPDALTLSPALSEDAAPAVIQNPIIADGVVGQALHFDASNKGYLGLDVGWYDRTDPFSVDFWFLAAREYDNVPVVSHRSEQNAGQTGWELTIENGKLNLKLAHSRPANMIELTSVEPFPLGQWTHVSLTYDGSSRAAGAKIYFDGSEIDTLVGHDSLTRTMLPWTNGNVFEPFIGLTVGTRFRAKAPVDGAIDELKVFNKSLGGIEVAYLHDSDAALAAAQQLRSGVLDLVADADPNVRDSFAALTAARAEHNELASAIPQVLVVGESPVPKETFVLNRGAYTSPGDRVEPKGLESVMRWDASLPQNRLGLAKWLFSSEHPLTARVFVNRMWQFHFGRGLVETSEDFGSQGSIPTHPELLDWLAFEFVESGWDIKALHKLIVSSSTYKQSSDLSAELLSRDARNELLARGPRWRMTAEMVRDRALAVSQLLTARVGGKSAKPYQPEGIWNPLNSFYSYPVPDAVDPNEHHRRSLYTFIKRNAPHPSMGIFDFTNRTESVARRRSSNTPLQALTLMNDPQFVEAYRGLATVVLHSEPGDRSQLELLYRIAARMTPTSEQLDVLHQYYLGQQDVLGGNADKVSRLLEIGVTPADSSVDRVELAAMTNVAALVMNSPDAYTVR